jgi:hypothetical protein
MNKFCKKGFTLVELIIYVAMFAGASVLLTGTLITVLRVQTRDAAGTDLSNQLAFVLDNVNRFVRESSLVEKVYEGTSEATTCANLCSVKLRMSNPEIDPTVITAKADAGDSGVVKIFIKQGASAEFPLTSKKIKVSSFKLKLDNIPGGHSILSVDASFQNNSTNPQLQITRSLKSAIGRVSAATFDDNLIPSGSGFNLGQNAVPTWNNGYFNGSVGIGTTNPTSKLQVVGLPVYANNAAAIAGGLSVGAFYRTGANPDPVMVVH